MGGHDNGDDPCRTCEHCRYVGWVVRSAWNLALIYTPSLQDDVTPWVGAAVGTAVVDAKAMVLASFPDATAYVSPSNVWDDKTKNIARLLTACVMAGMARSGSVYPLDINPDVLMQAFQNTVELLKSQVVVEE
mgnify:CR=1 FL=1